MSSVFGSKFRVTLYGESHGAAVGCVVDGVPAGTALDKKHIALRLAQRSRGALSAGFYGEAPRASKTHGAGGGPDGCECPAEFDFGGLMTLRAEDDAYEILSGAGEDGVCFGSPLCVLFRNRDFRRADYDDIAMHFRPGHADYAAFKKYGGFADLSGGGHFSGRLTAPLVFAGALAEQFLSESGIRISARIVSIGGIDVSDTCELQKLLDEVSERKDSVGALIAVRATGMPAGIGAPFFDTLEGEISRSVFAVPAVKGIEFGRGFDFAKLRGSGVVDAFYLSEDGGIRTRENNNGGINGGISNGMDLEFRVAVKPASSIGIPIQTLDFSDMSQRELRVGGRHDKCIALRAVAPVIASTALALWNQM